MVLPEGLKSAIWYTPTVFLVFGSSNTLELHTVKRKSAGYTAGVRRDAAAEAAAEAAVAAAAGATAAGAEEAEAAGAEVAAVAAGDGSAGSADAGADAAAAAAASTTGGLTLTLPTAEGSAATGGGVVGRSDMAAGVAVQA
jgi:hypothetical protein